MVDLTQNELKSVLHYDPKTGVFTWRDCHVNNAIKPDRTAGCINSWGYRIIAIRDVRYRAHRLAWLYTYGEWPKGQLDHINRNPDDNRIANLREATPQENQRNRWLPSNNTSGYPGVVFNKSHGKWIASITVSRKRIHLGTFDSKEQAIEARMEAESLYGFTGNHGVPNPLKEASNV